MTIVDTIADAHYGDKSALTIAFAALLNDEAHELAKTGVDVIQFDEPACNVTRPSSWPSPFAGAGTPKTV
jgi:5-methyltetrahydropteroyltriglutamate--homocysteine methyltransferase